MRKHGVRADRAAYNALINACAEAGDAARAEGALGQMTRAGLTPDVISYTSLIKAWAATGGAGAARADEIFHEMQQRTNHFSTFTPPSERTFRHMMAGATACCSLLSLSLTLTRTLPLPLPYP